MANGSRTIGIHQFTGLVIFFGIGSTILITPALLAIESKQDAWISSLAGLVFTLLPIMVYLGLFKRYPQMSLTQINELAFGKWIGQTISLLYIGFFLILSSLIFGNIGYFLTTEVMAETPIDFIMFCLLVVVIMAVRLGPEVMARGAEIFLPWVALLFISLVLFLLPQMEMQKIQPVLENGFLFAIKGSIPYVSWQEYIVLLALFPYLKASKKIAPAFYAGTIISGAVLFIIMFLCITILGHGLTSVNMYPSYALAKKISIGKFLERVEVIIGGLWFITITFKLMLSLFAAVASASHVFRFRSYTFLTVPLSILAFTLVLPMTDNMVYIADFNLRIWPVYSFTMILALPLLTLIVSIFRKRPDKRIME